MGQHLTVSPRPTARAAKALGYILMLGIGASLGNLDHGRLTAMAFAMAGAALIAYSESAPIRSKLTTALEVPAVVGLLMTSLRLSDHFHSDAAGMALWSTVLVVGIFYITYMAARVAETDRASK